MYNYGSSARKFEYDNYDSAEKEIVNTKGNPSKRSVQIDKMQKTALKYLAVAAVLLGVLMARDAQIDQLCGKITRVEDNIYEMSAIITEKEMQLSGQMDVNLIEKEAVERLHMVKPTEDMYVNIKVNKIDGGELLTEQSTQSEGFAAFINKAKILLEYLY